MNMNTATTATGTRQPSACRSCGESIVWLRNIRTNKLSPIEAAPCVGGNVRVNLADGTFDVAGPVYRREHPEEPYHLNHFARCRDAKRWHRSAGGKPGNGSEAGDAH